MLRRRREPQNITSNEGAPNEGASNEGDPLDDFHAWLLSLPWVVERPYSLDTPGVRCFGVDCEPLGRRQLWLITGLGRDAEPDRIGLAVIVPTDTAFYLEDGGRGWIVAPMPGGHALVTLHAEVSAGRKERETLALAAYCCAMS